MKKEPVKVSLIGKGDDNFYQIKFPNLQIPVNVNEELYQKMLQSSLFEFRTQFINPPERNKHLNPKKMLSV